MQEMQENLANKEEIKEVDLIKKKSTFDPSKHGLPLELIKKLTDLNFP